jgi:ABC-type transport system involved in multi-copper enzyme maturation permease subunit
MILRQVGAAAVTLTHVSFRRLLWSVSTLILLLLYSGTILLTWAVDFGARVSHDQAVVSFSGSILAVIYCSFLVPITALCYGTATIGGDREDKTLLFLLTRPTPRWAILFAKFLASAPLVLGFTLGGYVLLCGVAGEPGRTVLRLHLPTIFLVSLAYLCLFQLFSVSFKYATVFALLYALFLELLLSWLPGFIKYLSISHYCRSLLYNAVGPYHDGGLAFGDLLDPPDPVTCVVCLIAGSLGLLLASAAVFQYSEYADLS